MQTVQAIPALQDNYIWMIKHAQRKQAIVVDPGCATAVLKVLNTEELTLTDILTTHHHLDHTAGVQSLLEKFPNANLYTPFPNHESIDRCQQQVQEGHSLSFWDQALSLRVMAVPGHTLDHIAFVNDQLLFCGDTLFSSGCGRLFEGSYQQLFDSLQRLAQLPPETAVFCTHEYTRANLAFAMTVEPNNKAIQEKQSWVESRLKNKQPSLPSCINNELNTNPFLRTNHPDVISAASDYTDTTLQHPVEVFKALRQWKDHFIPK